MGLKIRRYELIHAILLLFLSVNVEHHHRLLRGIYRTLMLEEGLAKETPSRALILMFDYTLWCHLLLRLVFYGRNVAALHNRHFSELTDSILGFKPNPRLTQVIWVRSLSCENYFLLAHWVHPYCYSL